jgi:hypothetical protein
MAKRRKTTAEEEAEWEERDRRYSEMLRRRVEVDAKLRAQRESREQHRRGS